MAAAYPNNGFLSYFNCLTREFKIEGNDRFSKLLTGFRAGSKLTGEVLKDAGIELFFLVLFWLLVTKLSQGRDLIVSLFEPDGIYHTGRVIFTVLSVISYSVSMWLIPAFLFQQRDRKNQHNTHYHSIFKRHLFFVHRVLPLIPFWLLSFALFNGGNVYWYFIGFSSFELALLLFFNHRVQNPKVRRRYAIAVLLLLSVAVLYFLLVFQTTYKTAKMVLAIILYLISLLMFFIYHEVDRQILEENSQSHSLTTNAFKKYPVNSWFYLGYLFIHIAIVSFIFITPRRFNVAPESMILYIFSLDVFIIDLFVYYICVNPRRKFIVTAFLVIVFSLFLSSSRFNLNVNHYTIDANPDDSPLRNRERLTFEERYTNLKERIAAYTGKVPYPIILISGDGGGSRAGMWLSENLINFDYYTRGRFRDHIFSISTVSGSSVGLSTVFAFWEQPQRGDSIDKNWLQLPSKVYANNFVGSSITGFLLTDFWKTLIPWVHWKKDRNNTLQEEESFYTADACAEIDSGRLTGSDRRILDEDFMKFFYTMHDGQLLFRNDRPLVFINTCRSNDGRRGIFSPVKLGSDVFNDAIDIAGYLYDDSVCNNNGTKIRNSIRKNISLGQACNTSELFPLFSTPAYIDSLGSFVDGGYHENSGLKTTLDVYQNLKQSLAKDSSLAGKYKIFILYIKNGSSEKDLYKSLPSAPPLTLPLQALFNQPFEGSASYFEERAKYIDRKDPSVKFIEVSLNYHFITDTAKTSRSGKDSTIEKEILDDLLGAVDTTKKDTTLNFPLARWLSKSIIRRMRVNASLDHSSNDSLIALLDTVVQVNNIKNASLAPFMELKPNIGKSYLKVTSRWPNLPSK